MSCSAGCVGLSFIEEDPYGVFPHDVARDVLDADLRWRDRASYADLHRRVRRHLVEQARRTRGLEQHRWSADIIFLHRNNPLMRSFWDWEIVRPGVPGRAPRRGPRSDPRDDQAAPVGRAGRARGALGGASCRDVHCHPGRNRRADRLRRGDQPRSGRRVRPRRRPRAPRRSGSTHSDTARRGRARPSTRPGSSWIAMPTRSRRRRTT